MGELANGKRVSCELTGAKTYDRLVGTCYLGDQDIGVAVIAAGLALDSLDTQMAVMPSMRWQLRELLAHCRAHLKILNR